jgi:FtsH-like protein
MKRAALIGGGACFALFLLFWITWNSLAPSTAEWSYTRLVQAANAHDVQAVTIRGGAATAIDSHGRRFAVSVPSNDTALVHQLVADGVDVKLEPTPGLADLILPNLILLILLGGVVVAIIAVARAIAARRS